MRLLHFWVSRFNLRLYSRSINSKNKIYRIGYGTRKRSCNTKKTTNTINTHFTTFTKTTTLLVSRPKVGLFTRKVVVLVDFSKTWTILKTLNFEFVTLPHEKQANQTKNRPRFGCKVFLRASTCVKSICNFFVCFTRTLPSSYVRRRF